MKIARSWATSLLSGSLLTCAPLFAQQSPQLRKVIVRVDYDHSAPLNKIKSYSYGRVQSSDPKLEGRITATIDNVLEGEGFHLVSKNPDVILSVVDADRDSAEYAQFYRSIARYNWKRSWGNGGFNDSDATLAQIALGTLVVDIYDAKTGRLVWRGTAVEPPEQKSRKIEDDLDTAIEEMFRNFPPKSAGPIAPNQVEAPVGSCNVTTTGTR